METKAQEVGRNDALDWMSEHEPSEWAAELKHPAGDRLLQTIGYRRAMKLLGVAGSPRDTLATLAASVADAVLEYSVAYGAAIQAALDRQASAPVPGPAVITITVHEGDARSVRALAPDEAEAWIELGVIAGESGTPHTLWVEHAPDGFTEAMGEMAGAYSWAVWLDHGTEGSQVLALGVELVDALCEAIETADEWNPRQKANVS